MNIAIHLLIQLLNDVIYMQTSAEGNHYVFLSSRNCNWFLYNFVLVSDCKSKITCFLSCKSKITCTREKRKTFGMGAISCDNIEGGGVEAPSSVWLL